MKTFPTPAFSAAAKLFDQDFKSQFFFFSRRLAASMSP
jgi:hypothetical protein